MLINKSQSINKNETSRAVCASALKSIDNLINRIWKTQAKQVEIKLNQTKIKEEDYVINNAHTESWNYLYFISLIEMKIY
jgi:hypothetical protein